MSEAYDALMIIISSIYARDAYKKNEMNQYQLKGEWINLDGGMVNSV